MNRSAERVLAVAGGIKTGTSSVVALLNSHPDVFILYEAALGDDTISPRGREFLQSYPDARSLFRPTTEFAEPYEALRRYFGERGQYFRVVGVKKPSLDLDELGRLRKVPTIYCYRDIRTWLVKPQVRSWYLTDRDIVPAAVRYAAHLAESFRLENCLHVSVEEFVEDYRTTVKRIAAFLDIEFSEAEAGYWRAATESDHPKAAIEWETVHPSSRSAPRALDTEAIVKPHPFWDEILSIFDNYYGLARSHSSSRHFSEIDADLFRLIAMPTKYSLPFASAYESWQHRPIERGDVPGIQSPVSDRLKTALQKRLASIGLEVRIKRSRRA